MNRAERLTLFTLAVLIAASIGAYRGMERAKAMQDEAVIAAYCAMPGASETYCFNKDKSQ